jgi:hypothetical protein
MSDLCLKWKTCAVCGGCGAIEHSCGFTHLYAQCPDCQGTGCDLCGSDETEHCHDTCPYFEEE